MATSPGGQFMVSGFATLLVLMAILIPAIFLRRRPTLAAYAVLVFTASMTVAGYPKFEQSNEQYLARAKERASKGAAAAPPKVEEKNDRLTEQGRKQ